MGFKAVRLEKDFKMLVPDEQDRVFPLLCPVRENEWLPYWSCEIIHSDSGKAEKDCVFITNFRIEEQFLRNSNRWVYYNRFRTQPVILKIFIILRFFA